DTDTETIIHRIHNHNSKGKDLWTAFKETVAELDGAYSLGLISKSDPETLYAARKGSPLVIGIGLGEHFIASDVAALLPVTNRFIYLEDGDIVRLTRETREIYNAKGELVDRPVKESELTADSADKGPYRHYMLKEIYEQPTAIANTLEGRTANGRVLDEAFGPKAIDIFNQTNTVFILACGTSYHAGLIAKYWLESIARIPCHVEIASEFRYRSPVPYPKALVVTISQSGETADTLAALEETKKLGFGGSLAICNVPESSLVRASDCCLMTRAGPEVGVASTKAFTTQLVALMMLVLVLGRRNGLSEDVERDIVSRLTELPGQIEQLLGSIDNTVQVLAESFVDKYHSLFLGRGTMYPVAMEGALKLKEISYIHAEAYPAGELKHGPLALVDSEMPVITVAPNDQLLEKLKSNIHEVHARGGQLIVFADHQAGVDEKEQVQVIKLPSTDERVAPILYTVPLQLLSYHVAVFKGTDVDQPRNLAKSVTVE
ncbi:MAG: glutamine--fructose-6-phosphate transaminase (isomerizing), partial [Gammaproteobacteria bacterium]|nr:glutamine--fructose-6-phosphate transaminase (isomerizing) [Gammaproteobacteria bacterium]